MKYPGIRAAAAIAVPSEHGEDEVMVVIEPREGEAIGMDALVTFLAGIMPYFMVPRYIHTVEKLPMTVTNKVQKDVLRREGIAAIGVWDREAAGIVLRRQRL